MTEIEKLQQEKMETEVMVGRWSEHLAWLNEQIAREVAKNEQN